MKKSDMYDLLRKSFEQDLAQREEATAEKLKVTVGPGLTMEETGTGTTISRPE